VNQAIKASPCLCKVCTYAWRVPGGQDSQTENASTKHPSRDSGRFHGHPSSGIINYVIKLYGSLTFAQMSRGHAPSRSVSTRELNHYTPATYIAHP